MSVLRIRLWFHFSLAIFLFNLTKCGAPVGSDSPCRDGALVIVSTPRTWSSNIDLPICGDEVHGFLGVVIWMFLLSDR